MERAAWPMGARHPMAQPVAMEATARPISQRILLAIDQAGSSRAASDEAIRLAAREGAVLIVLTVVESHNLHLPGGRLQRIDQERDRLTAGAIAIVRRARAAGVRATYLIWEGDPAEAILEASHAERADLIVLGSRPRTNLRRLILGSVSSEVSRQAPCEVVVVPA
jgi:nucleotide-binding universal stress UspA family protein